MSNSNLYQASKEWAVRPDDQRFWTLEEMHKATRHYRDSAREAVTDLGALSLRTCGPDGASLELVGSAGPSARVTHHTFGQLARVVGAPADYLRGLPAQLAAVNVNVGLTRRKGDSANLLIHANDSLILRAVATDKYSRIWDCDVVERLLRFTDAGWRVPPARPCHSDQAGARPATEQDLLLYSGHPSLCVKVGDMIAPGGLYASDHDMFAFLVNEDRRIDDGTPDGMSRGFFVSNSEVADGKALKVTAFLYRHVCGNHIVWGANNVSEIKIVHRGNADYRFERDLRCELRRYADAGAAEDEQRITQARTFSLGVNKETVLDALFSKLRGDISRKALEAGYDTAIESSHTDSTIDPTTAWGMTQGLTAYSQTFPHADDRNKIDRAAGKVLQMAF